MQTRIGQLSRPFGKLYYEVTGSGPPIVFAHGLGGNHLSWWQQVAHFSPQYSCVTFAHRGFAPSEPVAGGPDPADYAGDLAALISHLSLERPVLVAQSMGGWSCVDYALANPGRVSGLVMACTTGTLDFGKAGRNISSELAAWQQRVDETLPRWARSGIHPACGEAFAKRLPALYELYKSIDRINAGLDKALVRQRIWEARNRPPADLAALDCPALFLSGADDLVVPPCGVAAVAAHAPRGRFVSVPETGHSVYFEDAARFNAELDRFISELKG
ncbi:alpha/beta fold hydrolase [Bosea sp. 2RAB26]|uniref:alpha/beta fold hydrolase n=1 Tax=Bosea sp. 2RAB26 TaxID=3237476 RepID=UPI003F93EB9B